MLLSEGENTDVSNEPVTKSELAMLLRMIDQQNKYMTETMQKTQETLVQMQKCLIENQKAMSVIAEKFDGRIDPLEHDYKTRQEASKTKKSEMSSMKLAVFGSIIGTAITVILRIAGLL